MSEFDPPPLFRLVTRNRKVVGGSIRAIDLCSLRSISQALIEGGNMSLEKAKEIITDAGMVFVATEENDQPRVRPMMSILTDDNKILTSTFPQSRKLSQIKNNPKAELCFVDRKLNHCRIEGKIAICQDKAKRSLLFNRVPTLRQFFQSSDDPNFVLLEVTPSKIEMMMIGERGYTQVSL